MRPLFIFLIVSVSLISFAGCEECESDTRPDLLVPDYITPDLVQKYFNAFDYSGSSYRNEYYFSSAWQRSGPYYIPANLMMPYLPSPNLVYPYYDPYGRFYITGADYANGIYEVFFSNGLWNQGGWIYWGQFNNGLYTGDVVTVYKYVFNEPNPTAGSLCKPQTAGSSTIRIKVVNGESEQVNDQSMPDIAPNSYGVTSSQFMVNQFGIYEITSTADINDDVNERNEENNDEPDKPGGEFGGFSKAAYGLMVEGKNISETKTVTFLNDK